MFVWLLGATLVGTIGGVVLAALLLLLPERTRLAVQPCLLHYAIGTLLAGATLGLIPRAAKHLPLAQVLQWVLVGILVFYVLEKLVLWRHCHDEDCPAHRRAAWLILLGDAVHNFIDGLALAAAFSESIPLGIATAVAVFSHELPQEVGDFAILLSGGFSARRAFAYNLLSALAALLGAVGGYFFFEELHEVAPVMMALSAASFLYIALADLMPTSHQRIAPRAVARQMAFILLGVLTIVLVHGHQHAAEERHDHAGHVVRSVSSMVPQRGNVPAIAFLAAQSRERRHLPPQSGHRVEPSAREQALPDVSLPDALDVGEGLPSAHHTPAGSPESAPARSAREQSPLLLGSESSTTTLRPG